MDDAPKSQDVHQAGALRGEPEAAEQDLIDSVEQAIVARYVVEKRNGGGFWPYCVRVVGGTMELFIGHKTACENVRAALQTACLDGAFMMRTAAPETPQAASGCSHTALRGEPEAAGQDETGWLIEMKFGNGLLWWSGEFDRADDDYQRARLIARMVSDAGEAVRFARREDAQRVLDGMFAAKPCPVLFRARELYSAQEHMWPAPPQAASGSSQGARSDDPITKFGFKHSHNRQGRPNEQQRTDRQGPRSSTDPDLQRRHAASAGQACSAGTGASLGHSQHPIAPQGGWGAGDDGARSQSVPDIAGAAGVLAAAGNVAEGVAALAASPQPAAPEGWKLVPIEATPEMVQAYLRANDAYWHRTDALPDKLGVWRQGTPTEATAESYRAMLAVAPAAEGGAS